MVIYKRQMKKKKGKVDLNFTIYYHISQGLNPTQIAKKYNWKKPKISYYIANLKKNGLIEKVGYGTWKTTSKQVQNHYKDGDNFLNFSSVRGHGFQFKLLLPRNIKNWEKRVEYLTKNNINYKLVGNKGSIVRIIHKNHKVWLCKNSIIIYYPKDLSFFSKSAKNSRTDAIHHFYSIVRQIEGILRVNLKKGNKYLFQVPKRHYSLIKNELAQVYLKENKKLEVRDMKGELWALIDNSHNLEELETIHPITAEKDTDDVLIPFLNLLRENPKVIQEIILNATTNTKLINTMQDQITSLTNIIRKG